MQVSADARRLIAEFIEGFHTFWRAFVSLLKASRLDEALAYGAVALLILMPVSWVGQALNWSLARASVWIAFSVLVIAVGFLILFAAAMTNEKFLRDVSLSTFKWPTLLSIGLGWLAVLVFGGVSCGFERIGVVAITPSVPFAEGCATRYADMYLWHLFDSIPGIKFTETVGWKQRYSYSDNLSGWLLVSFKVLVIVSVIGSFVVCGRLRREASSASNAATPLANKAAS